MSSNSLAIEADIKRVQRAVERHPPRSVSEDESFIRAAVALVFSPLQDRLVLTMIRRSKHPQDPWSGHMAFPGGRRDPEDVSELHTAIRETREEVGVVLSEEDCLGPLSPMRVPYTVSGTTMVIYPYVFLHRQKLHCQPNEEVDGVFHFPLHSLESGEGRGDFEFPFQGKEMTLDCIELQGCRIWGLSLRMLDELLARISANALSEAPASQGTKER